MGKKLRTALMIATALAAASTVVWMQSRYEAADQKAALDIVQGYHSSAGTSIPELLAARHPNKPVSWSTAVESSCYQHIRVHAVVDDPPAPDPRLYAFIVDINGPAIHPANDAGKELITELDQPLPVPGSTASAAQAQTAPP